MSLERSKWLLGGLTALALLVAPAAQADTMVTVDPAAPWLGYMNVFDLPVGSGGYLWGSPWGTADLPATFNGDELTLAPNTNTYDAADPYWVTPDGSGNKWMNASMYVEDTSYLGQNLTFTGNTVSNTFVDGYSSVAFIKVLDSNNNYSVVAEAFADLVGGTPFSVSLAIPSDAGYVPQYGFITDGANANPDTVAQLGTAVVAPIPEPASFALLTLVGALVARRR